MHGDEDPGQDLDDAHGIHGLMRRHRQQPRQRRREVLVPLDHQVRKLVQPEQDWCDDEGGSQDEVRLVRRVAVTLRPGLRVESGHVRGHGPLLTRARWDADLVLAAWHPPGLTDDNASKTPPAPRSKRGMTTERMPTAGASPPGPAHVVTWRTRRLLDG